MADPLMHVGATAMCPHGGSATFVPSPRVKFGGQPAIVQPTPFTIAGCVFTLPGPKPSPCITGQWVTASTRIKIGNQPAVLKTSSALCKSPEQAPQGPPNIVMTQMRVKGQ